MWTQHQQADPDGSASHVMPTKGDVETVLRELHAEWERRNLASCHGDSVPVAVQAPISNPTPTEAPILQPLADTGESNNNTIDKKSGPAMAAAPSRAAALGGVEDVPPAGSPAGASRASVPAEEAQPPPRKRARKASRDALVVAAASTGPPSESLGPGSLGPGSPAVAGAGGGGHDSDGAPRGCPASNDHRHRCVAPARSLWPWLDSSPARPLQ